MIPLSVKGFFLNKIYVDDKSHGSFVMSCFFNLRCWGKLRQCLNRKNCKCNGCVMCPVKVGLMQQLFMGHVKEPATGLQRVQTLLQKLSFKLRGQVTSLPFCVSYTGYLVKCVSTAKSCLSCTVRQGTLGHSRLSSPSHCGPILV